MSKRLLFSALLLSTLLLSFFPLASRAQDVAALLQAKDQALSDAIAPGDRAVWDKELAPEFLYVDENMAVMDRAGFLKELVPLPKGITGEIKVVKFQADVRGDTAVVVYRQEESEHYFGNELHAEYLVTETWQRFNGEWKLRATHVAARPIETATVALKPAQIDELAGTYTAGSLKVTIKRDGDRILLAREGKPDAELKAETRDVLITPGQPRSRKVFERDASGKVTGYADRRENRDLMWVRLK